MAAPRVPIIRITWNGERYEYLFVIPQKVGPDRLVTLLLNEDSHEIVKQNQAAAEANRRRSALPVQLEVLDDSEDAESVASTAASPARK